jgi:hypothetical protein
MNTERDRGGLVAGHYEVRDHPSIAGLLTICWCPDGRPRTVMVTIGADRLPLLGQAISAYLASN